MSLITMGAVAKTLRHHYRRLDCFLDQREWLENIHKLLVVNKLSVCH